KSLSEINDKLKEATKVVTFLTPLTKYLLSESANKITYDALQIHGGTGYMKEFSVERLFRDARITNIYEGTSQMQIVAASGGAINDVLCEYLDEWEKKEYKGNLSHLLSHLQNMRQIFYDCLKYLKDKKDKSFQDIAAKDIVEIYGSIYIGYLLLQEANSDNRKIFTARRFILDAVAKAMKNQETIKSELYSDVLHADTILL
ncbi:MAG TPA: acyl-CoA dehydrogenase family protein, partial [Ignavibacteriaceae bacterium]|nr:acyl-CoA dehydrogenase family protein [Ignavibacteriaceae bacterium]